ncbi:MAG: hypothetical protein IJR54_02390 [Oscillibacter sp.]|nr:hypothetical protein [Oscillibacter sp.]
MKKRTVWACLLTWLTLFVCACGATPEKSAPAPEEVPEDFSALAGTWYGAGDGTVLTVYDNGGFVLGDEYEGYLVYTEADGGMWESGPRYELYLENNERLPNCFLALDDGRPGELVYVIGGGAEPLSRERPEAVRVERAEEAALSDYDEFAAYRGEYEAGIVFFAERAVRDFKVLSVSLTDVDEDGTALFSVRELYAQETLTPERPLLVWTQFPGDIPSNGVSYVDDTGEVRYFSVSESGFDGSLIMTEFRRSADETQDPLIPVP